MLSRQPNQKYAAMLFALISLCYIVYEFFFNSYTMITVDEFWFAHRTYQYKSGLPYKDFSPYKTVLGYYLLLVPMLFSHGILQTLIAIKNAVAIFNAFILLIASLWLTRMFKTQAVIASLVLIMLSDIVLSFSTNIRVDLIAYWFCLFSMLSLLNKRYLIAGIFMGLGFCTSQKAIWYLFACNMALFFTPLLTRKKISQSFLSLFELNASTILVIMIYIISWSFTTNTHAVIHNIFSDASAMYQLNWYDHARYQFWKLTLALNPVLFLLSPLTLLSLCITHENDTRYELRVFATLCASTILCCLIPYKQPFPYYMQVTIPAFIVLYAAFFDWLLQLKNASDFHLLLPKPLFMIALILYVDMYCFTLFFFDLPRAYLLFLTAPVAFVLLIYYPRSKNAKSIVTALLPATIICMMFYALILIANKTVNLNGRYQKYNIELMQTLLKDHTDYVAGIELLYNQNQPIAGMRHLMGPAVDYLYQPTKELRAVMLPSLYEDPNATQQSVVEAFQQSKVKLLVNNYRLSALPKTIREYLKNNYEHFWGSIYLYAPFIKQDQVHFHITFDGHYLMSQTNTKALVFINHKKIKNNSVIFLKAGDYQLLSQTSFRLKLQPDLSGMKLNTQYENDDWVRFLI